MNFDLERLDALAGDVLAVLWRSSWQAAVLAGIVLIVQRLGRDRLPARWRYNLWLLVVLRLIVPVTPQSPMSVFNLWKGWTPVEPPIVKVAHAVQAPVSHVDAPRRAMMPAQGRLAAPLRGEITKTVAARWKLLLAVLWLAGVLVAMARIVGATLRLSREVRNMTPVDDPRALELLACCANQLDVRRRVTVLASNDLPAPALMGVLRPRILLPGHVLHHFPPAELRMILLHELAHLKRHDVLVNWLVALLHALHWFNPVLALAFARLRGDRELATDELVLLKTGRNERCAYGDTILKLLQSFTSSRKHPRPIAGAVGILERAHTLRRRITMIAQFRAVPKRRTLAAAACMLLLAGLGLTDAVRGDSPASATASVPPSSPSEAAPVVATARSNANVTPTTRPADSKLNTLIDDAVAKMLARSPHPSRGEIEAAMNELGKAVERERPFFTPDGKAADRKQVDAEILAARKTAAEQLANTNADHATPVAAAANPNAGTTKVQQKLRERVPEAKFDNMPFSDTIDFFRDVTGLNVFVDWRVLEGAGIDRNTPISLRLVDVPFETMLRYTLREAGGGTVKLDYAVVDGIVNISTADNLSVDTTVRVYNIESLVRNMPTTMPLGTPDDALRGAKVEKIIETIREAIASDSWRDVGGSIGSIRELNGKLVVTQTEQNHSAIAKLLEELSAEGGNGARAAW